VWNKGGMILKGKTEELGGKNFRMSVVVGWIRKEPKWHVTDT
jgi:hypothetical protein